MYNIILASGSPRRKEILEQVGVLFEVKVSDKEEIITKEDPEEIVKELALLKASDISSKTEGKSIIIGADTMVAINGQVLGKPHSPQEASNMLQLLQGNQHQVYTGVAIIIQSDINGQDLNLVKKDKIITFSEVSDVWVHPMNKEQIDAYIATGEPFDKAGGYGIQGKFAVHIAKIAGDYNNIVGFPVAKVYKVLLKEGINILNR